MIRFNSVSLVLGARDIFRDLSWSIPDGSRFGLVGDNGAGKTTLLRILMGEHQPDSGSVEITPSASMGYLPQDLVELDDTTIMEHLKERSGTGAMERELRRLEEQISGLAGDSRGHEALLRRHQQVEALFEHGGGYAFEALASRVLHGLGFKDTKGLSPCSELSGGWKMRVSLAALLVTGPDVLLLDEPTNHLDTESMEWLENYLSSFSGSLILISHDRRFLDNLTRETAELANGRITVYRGGYSVFREQKQRNEELMERRRKNREKEKARTMEFIETFRYKATKASLVQSRIRQLEKMQDMQEQDAGKTVRIRFPECHRSGLEVIRVRDVTHRYGDNTVFSNVDLAVRRGSKVTLVGVNGAGKSTLSRLISRVEAPTEGCVSWGHNVRAAFFSQENADNLRYNRTVWEETLSVESDCSDQRRRTLLGSFLFTADDLSKPVSVLSGGEKSRLALLKILLNQTNLLVLDEPSNHLDITTRELFQQALREYNGTIILVSHDRYFLDTIADHIVEIRNGNIIEYPGNYTDFIRKRAEREKEEAEKPASQASGWDRKRLEAERRNRIYQEKKAIRAELDPLEEKIAEKEEEMEKTESLLSDPDTLSRSDRVTELMRQRDQTAKTLEAMMTRWEELMAVIEEIESSL
ncbi:MAG: ATP-binding cassette domain-containing protein [Synergistota bacterium]|nr:ATP-binding cassette domain-containing protein [Synergistota bacterium]